MNNKFIFNIIGAFIAGILSCFGIICIFVLSPITFMILILKKGGK